LRLSAVLLAVAETALELIIIVNEITYIVIIDQEMPSDHYHLHLGHDSVVPQLCSSMLQIIPESDSPYESRLRLTKGRQHLRET
jgi:hypothetical protein